MPSIASLRRLAAVALLAATAFADSPASDKFHRAYYLEHEKHDYAAAAKLYGEAASDPQLKVEARRRQAGCQEELAASDFTRLAPAHTLVYAELNRPAEQLERLLRQVGVLKDETLADASQRRVAISPELISGVIGIRGVAAAVTGFDPERGKPSGVLIFHAGDVAALRGLIESALPAAAAPADPIGGFDTFNVEDEVSVTLTHRLVIVSPQRTEIEGVVEKLKGDGEESLADNESIRDELASRGDAALFVCANFEQVMPLLQVGMAAAAGQSRELAIAQQLLDLKSLRMLTVRAGVTDGGLAADVRFTLADGHRNLAFHFLRGAAVDPEVLAGIPKGAAGFAAFALSTDAQQYASGAKSDDEPIAALDLGREIFANLQGAAAFVVPGAETRTEGGDVIPGAALVMTVKDPVKSTALWTQLLGVASLASGGGTLDGTTHDVGGVQVREFAMPEGIRAYFARDGQRIWLGISEQAIAAALAPGRESILQDAAFAPVADQLDEYTTFVASVNVGRCLEIAQNVEGELDEEIAEFAPLLERLCAALTVSHGPNSLAARVRVAGLPDLGPTLTRLLESHGVTPGRTKGNSRLTEAPN